MKQHNKLVTFVSLLAATGILFGTECANAQQEPEIIITKSGNVTNYRIKGSLESSQSIKCIPFKMVSKKHTPPDIYTGVTACMNKGKYDQAAKLMLMARLYGVYDAKRVADKTAGQGIRVLDIRTLSSQPNEKRVLLSNAVKRLAGDKKLFGRFCIALKKKGHPDYHPRYMILHGIKAFNGSIQDDGLVTGFESRKEWGNVMARSCKTKG
ncbi:MAG: hypothetical protein ABUK11_07795 [Mariprofundaceae bacterium]